MSYQFNVRQKELHNHSKNVYLKLEIKGNRRDNLDNHVRITRDHFSFLFNQALTKYLITIM